VAINDESQKALLVDPTNTVPAFIFDILDQSSTCVLSQAACVTNVGNVAAAMNPLTNIGVILNQTNSNVSVVDPITPTVTGSPFSVGTSPVDVAIDPATDTALVVAPGPPGSVSMFPLGALRSPQIAQSSVAPAVPGSTQSSLQVILNSSLGSAAVPQNQTLTLIGNFPSGSVPRLDGDPTPFSGISISNGGRVLTATLSGATLASNGPRQYAIDVLASGFVSNAARLQVIQAVSLITSDCAAPAPQGVAIDAVLNVAVVTEPGCNDVSMVNVAYNDPTRPLGIGTGFGPNPELAVGTTPTGVAVSPLAHLAVVANSGSNSVSVVDIVNDGVPTTFTTDPIPAGVAINPGTGQAVVASNGASVVDTFPVSTTAQTPTRITVQQGPIGVAIDSVSNLAVVANSTANDASLVNLGAGVTTHSTSPGSIPFPQGVAFDPITDTFMITASANNQVVLLNPNTGQTSNIRVGIGPSSIAYNFASATLVTANNLSGTMTVVDFLDQTVRGVFSLPSSTQFAVAIHPQTNLAVVADPVHNQVLLVPLPH
jgi:DNA-binding beta-propeller fold protein YncE